MLEAQRQPGTGRLDLEDGPRADFDAVRANPRAERR